MDVSVSKCFMAIWLERNGSVLNRIKKERGTVIKMIKFRTAVWFLALRNLKGISASDIIRGWFDGIPKSRKKAKKHANWCPPQGLLKLNFDGRLETVGKLVMGKFFRTTSLSRWLLSAALLPFALRMRLR